MTNFLTLIFFLILAFSFNSHSQESSYNGYAPIITQNSSTNSTKDLKSAEIHLSERSTPFVYSHKIINSQFNLNGISTPFFYGNYIINSEIYRKSIKLLGKPPIEITDRQFQMHEDFFYYSFINMSNIIGPEIMEKELSEFQKLDPEKIKKTCSYIKPFFEIVLLTEQATVLGLGSEIMLYMNQKISVNFGMSPDIPIQQMSPEFISIAHKYSYCQTLPLKPIQWSRRFFSPWVPDPTQKKITDLMKSYFPFFKWIESATSNAPPFENPFIVATDDHLKEFYGLDYKLAWDEALAHINKSDTDEYKEFLFQVYTLPFKALQTLSEASLSHKDLCEHWVPFSSYYNGTLLDFIFSSPDIAQDFLIKARAEVKVKDPSLFEESGEALKKLDSECQNLSLSHTEVNPNTEKDEALEKELNKLFKIIFLFQKFISSFKK